MAKKGSADSEEEKDDDETEEEEGTGSKKKKAPKESDAEGDEEEDDEEGEDEDESDEDKVDDDPEVGVRRSHNAVSQQVVARKQKKADKTSRSKQDEDAEDEDEDEEKDDKEEKGDDIDARVRKHIEPLQKTVASQADESELRELFADTPEAKRYDKAIRKFMTHPAWSGVPIAAIYHHLAFGKVASVISKKRDDADREASHTRSGGRNLKKKAGSGKLPSADEIAGMSEEEIGKLGDKVKQGQFTQS